MTCHLRLVPQGAPRMLAKSTTCAVVGLDGVIVEVEVDISPGLPSFTMVAKQPTGTAPLPQTTA